MSFRHNFIAAHPPSIPNVDQHLAAFHNDRYNASIEQLPGSNFPSVQFQNQPKGGVNGIRSHFMENKSCTNSNSYDQNCEFRNNFYNNPVRCQRNPTSPNDSSASFLPQNRHNIPTVAQTFRTFPPAPRFQNLALLSSNDLGPHFNSNSSHAPNYQNTPTLMQGSAATMNCNVEEQNSNPCQDKVSLQSPLNFTIMTAPPVLPVPLHLPPPVLPGANIVKSNDSTCYTLEEQLSNFITKFSLERNNQASVQLTVAEFRSFFKLAFSLLNMLSEKKNTLEKDLDASEDAWNSKLKDCLTIQDQLSEICNLMSLPNVSYIIKKLKLIKKKRRQKRITKENIFTKKKDAAARRKELHLEIDKWLDSVKEKNLKLKREAEMKKEADNILSEVRKKIYDTKRTIEKIKALEKLRNARQMTAAQKGLYIMSDTNDNFRKKILFLQETMCNQLSGYEAEEKALKVMLESEQEGQLEEEAKWRLKKLQTIQQKKHNHIYECLFGESDKLEPSDPLYLFYQHYNSANNSIENLIQIRQQWDIYLSNDGESIPLQWVAPALPSTPSWNLLRDPS